GTETEAATGRGSNDSLTVAIASQ
ncbi:hypothetical protein A2U01_0109856, partial [Trifolium medium]|nr:hypothetical protein [Trifolium medium]